PIKGKILNVEKARLDKILSNEEIRTIISALGTGVGEEFDINRLRYHKIILMADADVDGSHIRTLLLTLLYRHFPKLIEEGYVYIAQPPLYKIKRGQREEYIPTETEFNRLLLDLGREGLKFVNLRTKNTYTDAQFKEILGLLVELEKYYNIFQKKGIDFQNFLNFRHQKTKKFPLYWAKVGDKTHFYYSDEELAKIKDQETKIVELFEAPEIEKISQRLDKLDLDILTFISPKKEIVNKSSPKPLYRVIDEEKRQNDFFSLLEALDFVKESAKKGLVIQRYKGLGEMNPQQLWETTMDPEKRTLLKVTLEDAVEADRIFTVLMGEEVEPRKEFIQNYAHEVK
ncbi:MAG: toprim domain-containing protein, partial [Candidatus Omnitrophica bacterium]|nr:toprim domain-containing protein [Candidatus Omnitrophota bacterium]